MEEEGRYRFLVEKGKEFGLEHDVERLEGMHELMRTVKCGDCAKRIEKGYRLVAEELGEKIQRYAKGEVVP